MEPVGSTHRGRVEWSGFRVSEDRFFATCVLRRVVWDFIWVPIVVAVGKGGVGGG